MRLIDADVFRLRLASIAKTFARTDAQRSLMGRCIYCLDKTSCGICPYKDIQTEEQIDLGGIECIAVLHDDALAMLKEQEPVEPSVDVDTYVCPNCGHRLEHQGMLGDNVIFDERYNFCPACGKAVKWK